jgi:hypothetical protein
MIDELNQLTDLHTELSALGINEELTESDREELEFTKWEKEQQEKSDNDLVRSVLSNAGINPDGDLHEQLQDY